MALRQLPLAFLPPRGAERLRLLAFPLAGAVALIALFAAFLGALALRLLHVATCGALVLRASCLMRFAGMGFCMSTCLIGVGGFGWASNCGGSQVPQLDIVNPSLKYVDSIDSYPGSMSAIAKSL